MKAKHILCGLCLAAVACCPVAQAQQTQKFTAAKTNEYGLVYTLPNTVLDITLEVEITQQTPGEYSNYARKYLNVSDPITKASSQARVVSAHIVPRGVANEDNRWQVQFKSGSSPFVMLTPGGVPLGINTEQVYETATATLPTAKPKTVSPLDTEAGRQAVTQEMIQSPSSAKRAELAAARIYELREARNDIISGQSDQSFPDGQALQLALDNLSGQEAALTAMFVGVKTTETQVVTLTYVPETEGQSILCRISATEGVVAANDLSGAPVYIDMTVATHGTLPVNEKGEEKKFPKGGVAYTIPGTAQITLTYEGRTLASQQEEVAQLGSTFGIDPAIFTDKKAPSAAIFNPATGALVEIKPM